MLGCGSDAEDSFKDYCRCATVQKVLRVKLRTTIPPRQALASWTLSGKALNDHSDLTCISIMCYATYIATSNYRHRGRVSKEVAMDALGQYFIQAVIGHAASSEFLNSVWVTGRTIVI